MSLDPSTRSPAATAPSVAAVVVAHEPSQLALCLDTIGRQVYEPAHLFVVGDDEEVRRIAKARQASWRPTVASVLESVPADVTFLWLLHSGARPRPDALAALVSESQRVDASVAGSKILLADRPEVLLSVGMATDVFDAPYSGLEEGELDQEQYDVVRDVAAVPGSSMLIRRDLMVGLKGPDPLMAPNAASIDFCQRARLRGGRIVVIPSSEVLFERPAAADGWREHAGQIRSMAKVYSLLTLLWALPLAFVVGVAESIVSPLLGRWRLFGFVRAWGWNVVHLPSLLIARRQARRGRVVGDEELFRHQMNGSARLFALFQEAGERIRGRFPKGVLGGFSDVVAVGQQSLRRPAFVTGLVAVGLALLATRGIWGGRLPAVGFSLPPPESAGDALRAYAGGWNPAGLGTPKPLRPAVGATALLQHVFLGKAGLTAAGLTVLAFIGGVFGTARLLRRWGIGSVAGYLAGLVLMGGPATRALAGDAHWTALLALGVLPWVLAAALLPWPDRWIGRAGRAASLALLTGLAAAYLPLLLVVPVASLALWSALGMGPMWGAASRAGVGAVLAAPLLLPWIADVDLGSYLAQGSAAYWEPSWFSVGVFALAVGATLVSGDRVLVSAGTWGALIGTVGVVLARTGTLGAGREVQIAGQIIAALGVAVTAGVALELGRRVWARFGWRRVVGLAGSAAGVLLVAGTLLLVLPGRAGLPRDELRPLLEFTASQQEDPSRSRVLLLGPADTLPGTSREIDGAGYRLAALATPRLWDVWLGDPRGGDEELEAQLRAILDGQVVRGGEVLSSFGVRWVVLTGDSPFGAVLPGQLDLMPLAGLSQDALLNEAEALRAVPADGSTWVWEPPGYRGPEGSTARVYIAENADPRWGPGEWRQVGWANEVGAVDGVIDFQGSRPRRRLAIIAGVWLAVLVVTVGWGAWRELT